MVTNAFVANAEMGAYAENTGVEGCWRQGLVTGWQQITDKK